MKLVVHISDEAMEALFKPLAPCPECKRPLPVPFEDNYEHWEGCWVGAREKDREMMSCRACSGPCAGPCEEGDAQFEHERQGNLADAVGKFLTDVFWDEMGNDTVVAIFNVDEVNDLRNALERSCGGSLDRKSPPNTFKIKVRVPKIDCCREEIEKDSWAFSGERKPGDLWWCPKCKTIWVHNCDEAEGCDWMRKEKP